MNKYDILKELKWRGIISNITDEDKFKKICELENQAVYVGFDPSFKSLHLGNFVMMRMLKMFKKYGFKTVAIVGGATGMIGDPSGKSSERNLLDANTINNNVECIKKQLEKYVNPTHIFNNYEIWSKMDVITFLRDIGKSFNVNVMLEKDIVKNRLETGISFTEFSYSILQSYDWIELNKEFNVSIQLGGSDQWGNITAGTNLFRKMYDDNYNVCGITINLLTKSDGTKFGKSEGGAIYLDKEITPAYNMYHFLINQRDEDLEKLYKFFTDFDENEINKILSEHNQNPKERKGQLILTKTIFEQIHGLNSFEESKKIATSLFNENYSNLSEKELLIAFEGIQSSKVNDINILLSDVLVEQGFFKSKREVRDLVSQGGLKINGNKIEDAEIKLSNIQPICNKYYIIKKGKKTFFLLEK